MKKLNILRYGSLIGLFFLSFSGVFAQADFSGSWAFNQSKSKLGGGTDGPGGGPGGPMAATALVVAQDTKLLTVDQTMAGRDGEEIKMSGKYNLDGTESTNTFFMDMQRKSTLTWSADKKSITIASTMVMDRGGETREMKETETWSISDDGKTLFIESTRPGMPGGPEGAEGRKMTLAYDKK